MGNIIFHFPIKWYEARALQVYLKHLRTCEENTSGEGGRVWDLISPYLNDKLLLFGFILKIKIRV